MRASCIVTKSTPYETTTMTFDELPEFEKERKRLARKFRSLSEDLQEFQNVVSVAPLGTGKKHFAIIAQSERVNIVKARLFCRYLKGSSLRVIYAYCEQDERIEFLEIYFKGDKETEDHDLVRKYLTEHQN